MNTELAISIAAVMASGAWTALKASDWYQGILAERYQWLVRIAVAVVRMTYHGYVRRLKQETKAVDKNAKLSAENAASARTCARVALREQILMTWGDKIGGLLGEVLKNDAVADSFIEEAVMIAKDPAKFKQP
jgi:hypothetical protein